MVRMLKSRSLVYGVLALITIASLAGAIYFYFQYQQTQLALKNPTLAAQQQASATITSVGQLMDLPKNEQPTIATVSDITKLKDQPFFANAQNGDKVLIYTKAKQAILYRPLTNKIIAVAPVNLGNTTPVIGPVNVALYNGTTTSGLTTTAEAFLKSKFTNVTVVAKQNAAQADYTQTEVIDLSGKNKDMAQQIATAENGKVVSQLPNGEQKPTGADILVILGK